MSNRSNKSIKTKNTTESNTNSEDLANSNTHSEENEIDEVLNSESDNPLDIDADTETMNNQLNKQMDKQNKKKQSQSKLTDSDSEPKKICQIDKNTLKTLIVEWLSLDDQIKSYNEVVKDLKDEKKQFESQILELMGALKQEVILTDKGNLTRTVKESKEPLTPDLIKSTLAEILKCNDTADTYTNQIMDKRKIKEVVNLKRKEMDGKGKGKKGKGGAKQNGGRKPKGKKGDNNDEPVDV
jgi:hypothetical protein